MFILKKFRPFAFVTLAALMACGPNPQIDDKTVKDPPPAANNDQPADAETLKISEALGHFIGRNLNTPGIHFDLNSVIKGIREGAEGKPAPMNDEEYGKAMAKLQEKAMNALAETNLKAADKFIQENATAKGVVEIVPGKLYYIILEEGKGAAIPEHGTPLVNYTGKYLNGTVFGSSESAGGPISVPMDQTIPGFSKGIAGMKEGEKRRLFVHPDLGYGRTGQLAPNSLLIFDVEAVKATSPEREESDEDEEDLEHAVENAQNKAQFKK